MVKSVWDMVTAATSLSVIVINADVTFRSGVEPRSSRFSSPSAMESSTGESITNATPSDSLAGIVRVLTSAEKSVALTEVRVTDSMASTSNDRAICVAMARLLSPTIVAVTFSRCAPPSSATVSMSGTRRISVGFSSSSAMEMRTPRTDSPGSSLLPRTASVSVPS